MHASPLGLPIGLQLYSVRDLLAKDFAGTLRQLAALGYQEVESFAYYNYTAAQVGQMLRDTGLTMPSAHASFNDLAKDFDRILEFHHALGMEFLVCSFPGFRHPERLKDSSYRTAVQSFTLDDFRYTADQFNKFAAKVKSAGMRFAYHNHTMEFVKQEGVVPFEELLRLTDPQSVEIELDCGWVLVGGGSPVECLERHGDRIALLHVKDFKASSKPVTAADPPPAAELGTGIVDYHPIFAAAKKARIRHAFVEQEEFRIPPYESLKINLDFMKKFS